MAMTLADFDKAIETGISMRAFWRIGEQKILLSDSEWTNRLFIADVDMLETLVIFEGKDCIFADTVI